MTINVLKPGGYLAFESRNPAVQMWNTKKTQDASGWYTPSLRKKIIDSVKGPLEVWSEIVTIQDENVTTDIHYLFSETGEEIISHNTLRFRSREAITKTLEKTGFLIENVYGNWDWSMATSESPEFIFVVKRV